MLERKEALKEQYSDIELPQKRRLKNKETKLKKNLLDLETFLKELKEDFFSDFDLEMDFLANQATMQQYEEELRELEEKLQERASFLKPSNFALPQFQVLPMELDLIEEIGRIEDTREFKLPICLLNTFDFQVFEFQQKSREFRQVQLQQTDSLESLLQDMPRFFQSLVVEEQKIFLAGGVEKFSPETSQRAYLLDNGKLVPLPDMQTPRQYFALCLRQKNQVYAIGGFNQEEGVLEKVERFDLQ